MAENIVRLEELTGNHILAGVSSDYDNGAYVGRFILDGMTLEIIENAEDDYRSYCGDVYLSSGVVLNVFTPVVVVGTYENSVLTLRDKVTGKAVLTMGTDYSLDDLYPCAVFSFDPTAMCTNIGVERA